MRVLGETNNADNVTEARRSHGLVVTIECVFEGRDDRAGRMEMPCTIPGQPTNLKLTCNMLLRVENISNNYVDCECPNADQDSGRFSSESAF